MDSSQILQYRLGEIIGDGPSGIVYRGADRIDGRAVAVKILHRMPQNGEPYANIDYRENLKGLEHPNLCQVLEYVDTDSRAVVIEEFINGTSLDRILSEHRSIHPSLSTIAIPVTRGLASLHRAGIIHGNIKPSNICVQPSGEIRLLDAGLGGQLLSLDESNDDTAPVWMRYLAPEQIQGEKATEKTDLYQLGLVLYELAYQVPAFREHAPESLRDSIVQKLPACDSFTDISGDWVLTLDKLLAKAPGDRFESAEELLVTLEEMVQFDGRRDLLAAPKKRDASPRQYFMMSVLVALLLILWYVVTTYH